MIVRQVTPIPSNGIATSPIDLEIKEGRIVRLGQKLDNPQGLKEFFFKQKTAYEISACLVGSEMCIRDRNKRVCLVKYYSGRPGSVENAQFSQSFRRGVLLLFFEGL